MENDFTKPQPFFTENDKWWFRAILWAAFLTAFWTALYVLGWVTGWYHGPHAIIAPWLFGAALLGRWTERVDARRTIR